MADTVFNPGPRCGVRWSEGAGRMCREGSSGSHVGRDPRAWLGDEEGLADGSRPEGSHSELTRVWKTRQRGRGKRGEGGRSDGSVCACVCVCARVCVSRSVVSDSFQPHEL